MAKDPGIRELAAIELDDRPETIKVRYNYRLRVNPVTAALLQEIFDVCRFVWNQALGRWRDLWRYEQCAYTYKDADKELTDWRSRFDWLAAQPSVPEQQVLRDLFRSISAFFDKGNPAGRPKFKKKGRYSTARFTKNGFSVTGTGLGEKGDRLSVATRLGRREIPVVWSRPLPAPPSSVTVFRDATGHYYASFVVELAIPQTALATTGRTSGFDVGLTTLATLVDPEMDIDNPRHLKRARKDLKEKRRSVSRKKKGSHNRERARLQLARAERKVKNTRVDHHHKQARRALSYYDALGYEEDLHSKNMMRKAKPRPDPAHPGRYLPNGAARKTGLDRSIADAAWAQLILIACFQALKLGKFAIGYPKAGTTQNCSECGTKAKVALGLKDRVFSCDACGYETGRDRNSARNLDPRRQGWSGRGVEGSKTRALARAEAA